MRHIEGHTLIQAGIVRKYKFDNVHAYNEFVEKLARKNQKFNIIESFRNEDGSYIVTFITAYNAVPFIHLKL